MRVITSYACEICGAEYETAQRAVECETLSPPRPKWRPGDKALAVFSGGAGEKGETREVEVVDVFVMQGSNGRHYWLIDKTPDYLLRDSDHYDPGMPRKYCREDELRLLEAGR